MQPVPLLLHTCCAPCYCYVHELLATGHAVTCLYFNPNIYPEDEYLARLAELERFSLDKKFTLIRGAYTPDEWEALVAPVSHLGERSERCRRCYRYRLEHTFLKARELGFALVGSVMSISPYKDAKMLNDIGRELSLKYGIAYLEADFKKQDGYKKSMEAANHYGFYRQNYCGCRYSQEERALRVRKGPA